MKKFLIGGVVAGVIAVIIVVTSMVTGGGDKFVGTWYRVGKKSGLLWKNKIYLEEFVIKEDGGSYQIAITEHFYELNKKWEQGETVNLIAKKVGNHLEVDYLGILLPIEYVEENKTLVFDKTCYKKVDSDFQKIKDEFEPQMEQAEQKRRKNQKSTDGLGCRYDKLSDLIKTNKKK